jgi:hypothetical protein
VTTVELQQWREAFAEHRFLILQSVLTDPLLEVAYQYLIKRALFSRETTDDGQVPGAPSFYADPLMETLLELTQSVAESFSGLELLPTYSYARVYPRGAILNPHADREACEISLSLTLGYDAPEIWPLHISTPHGIQTAQLARGDAVLYRGCECPHWRGEFMGEHHAQVFFHYVDRNGPHAEWKFDKRQVVTLKDSAGLGVGRSHAQ